MTTYNFWCLTDDCSVKGNNWITLSDEEAKSPVKCWECDKEMKRIGQKAGAVIGMTMDQISAEFKQRSKDHFQREVRPEKERLERKIKGLD